MVAIVRLRRESVDWKGEELFGVAVEGRKEEEADSLERGKGGATEASETRGEFLGSL